MHRFFEYYAPQIPGIFDADQDPDVVYANNKFLFWSIIQVGSRRYAKDPTIVDMLARSLKEFAHQSLLEPEHAISTIRATIAICLWPIPVSSTWADPVHAMIGAALQLGIHKGLPFASKKQDFVNVPVENFEPERLFRARLWAYCQMVAQRSVEYFAA